MSRFAFTYEDPDYDRDEDELPETADEDTDDSYDPFDTVNS
jgi:hypothetical protein